MLHFNSTVNNIVCSGPCRDPLRESDSGQVRIFMSGKGFKRMVILIERQRLSFSKVLYPIVVQGRPQLVLSEAMPLQSPSHKDFKSLSTESNYLIGGIPRFLVPVGLVNGNFFLMG